MELQLCCKRKSITAQRIRKKIFIVSYDDDGGGDDTQSTFETHAQYRNIFHDAIASGIYYYYYSVVFRTKAQECKNITKILPYRGYLYCVTIVLVFYAYKAQSRFQIFVRTFSLFFSFYTFCLLFSIHCSEERDSKFSYSVILLGIHSISKQEYQQQQQQQHKAGCLLRVPLACWHTHIHTLARFLALSFSFFFPL